jgi:uncharacterized protein (TIGR03437 family)
MAAAVVLAALVFGPLLADSSGTAGAPIYTAASIANSAANVAGYYAPDSFLSIYGQNLAYVVKPIGPDDVRGGQLPTALIGTGVRVLLNLTPANMFYVSPTQVNVLIPTSLVAGPTTLQLVLDGLAGPAVTILVQAAAPVLFQSDATTVIATHGNGPLVTAAQPAQRSEVVVLYATGLGLTAPPVPPNQIPRAAAEIADRANFRVVLNGVDVDTRLVLYAGVTPGFAGLFQINLQLPDDAPPNPEIQIGYGSQMSPAGRSLPLR